MEFANVLVQMIRGSSGSTPQGWSLIDALLPESTGARDVQKAAQNVFPPTTTVISVMYIYRGVEQQGENESAVLAELSSN